MATMIVTATVVALNMENLKLGGGEGVFRGNGDERQGEHIIHLHAQWCKEGGRETTTTLKV